MKIWNLGLLLQALSKIGFLCIQSHFHVWVTQINPISNQKEASSQPPPNPCPDPDSCGLLTSPQGRSCKWTSAVVPLVGQWRAEPRGVACKLWANTWVVCARMNLFSVSMKAFALLRHCNTAQFVWDIKVNKASFQMLTSCFKSNSNK